jgi:protein kinase A
VLLGKGHGLAVDWWTLGILIYEMIIGQPPFCDEEPMGIYQKILGGKIYFPKHFDKHAKTLVKSLLEADLSRRIGNLRGGSSDILRHPWIAGVDLQRLLTKQIPSPYMPFTRDESDMSNFDTVDERDDLAPIPALEFDPFNDW